MGNKYTNRLEGRRVLLIGGTKGIGYGVAEASIEFGASVYLASSKQESVDSAVNSLKKSYPEASNRISGQTVDMNSSDIEAELKKLFELVTEGGKHKLDHIVNTAGTPPRGVGIADIKAEDIEEPMRLRVTAMAMLGKFAITYLNRAHTSSITLTSGALVYKPSKGRGAMMGAGGAIEALTRGLAVDLAPIRVNLVSPGAIKTGLLLSFAPPEGHEAMLKMFGEGCLLGRVGDVEDVAEVYVALMKSGFVTGTVYHCEGGFLLK